MDTNKQNGIIIRRAREKAGFSQEQLAEKLFVTKQAVSKWENGRSRPDEDIRYTLSKALEIRLDYSPLPKQKEAPYMDIMALDEIKSIDDLEEVVSKLISTVELDGSNKVVIQKVLRLLLIQALGYYCYYMKRISPKDSRDPDDTFDWGDIAYYLYSIIDITDDWPLPDEGTNHYFYFSNDLMKKKHMTALTAS